MSAQKLFFFLLLLSVSVAPVFVPSAIAESDDDAALSAIDGAEVSVVSAYEAVLEAEADGVDVSGLLVRLNDAGELLVEAHVAYGLENFDEAVGFAGLCSEVGDSVNSDAVDLRLGAQGSRITELWLTMVGSLMGVVVVFFVGFFGWGVVKRRFVRRVLEMKVEVGEGDER
jgi:hypothetical protein